MTPDPSLNNLDPLFHLSLDLLCIAGLDGYFKRVNPAFEKTLGYSTEEMLSRPFFDFVHPEDRERTRAELRKLGDGKDTLFFENRYLCKNGEYRWLAWRAPQALPGSALVYAVARDVTEEKRLAEALHSMEERWMLAAQANNDGVWDWDLRTNKVYFSPRWKSMLGYSEEEVSHDFSGFESVCHPEDLPKVWDMANRYLAGTEPAYQLRIRLRHKDGKYRWIFTRGIAVRDEDGRPYRMVGSHTDVTEALEAEQKLLQTMAQLEAASKAKSEFLSRMSHELRTPLHAVLGFGQLLEMAPLPDDQRQCVDHILKAGRHLLGLINEVLDISRIEAGHMPLTLEAVPVREVLDEVIPLLDPMAREKRVRVALTDSCDFNRPVRADRQRLKQILLNLGANAVKYNRRDGSVRISVQVDAAGTLQIAVADTGVGFSEDKLERLYIPFDRLGAEQSGVEGTGLGLALAKRLVDAMGGRLLASSIPNQGSTFTVELPLADDATIAPLEAGEKVTPQPLSTDRTLLYVEDNVDNQQLMKHILRLRPGLKLVASLEGSNTLQLARQHSPDLILLDLHLPDASGEELLIELKSDDDLKRIPVVILSADATPQTLRQVLDPGAAEYLTKPLEMKTFLETLDHFLLRG